MPNVELVSTLVVLYALIYDRRDAIIVSVLFVLVEVLIYGLVWYWVVLYLIYWPMLAFSVSLIPQVKYRVWIAVGIAIVFTLLFGVLSSIIEVAMVYSIVDFERFWYLVYIRYLSGIYFFVIHIVSNAIVLPTLVPILYKMSKRYTKSVSYQHGVE